MSLIYVFIVLSALGIFAGLSASFLNLYSVKWGLSDIQVDRKSFSKVWHTWSWLLRFAIGLIILFAGLFSSLSHSLVGLITLIFANVAFTGYNLIYNNGFGHKWYYTGSKASGTGSTLDKILGKGIIVMEGLLLIFTVFWYPLNIVSQVEIVAHNLLSNWVETLIAAILIPTVLIVAKLFYNQKL